MRQFREFEINRLKKIVENAREPTDEARKLEAHNLNLVIRKKINIQLLIIIDW